MQRIVILILIISNGLSLYAQDDVLERYIKQGLSANLEIKQKQSSYEKSTWALKEARGLFLPSLSLNARYSFAHGGRTIDLPVGDMMNPVYQTLNLITVKMNELGLSEMIFPNTSIENETISFLREREHETKLQLIQPLFHPEIFYNYKIKKEIINIEAAGIDNIKRKIVSEIKTTYFSYLLTQELIALIQKTISDLENVISINKKLYEIDKTTIDVIYRLEAEKDHLKQQQGEAEKASKTASSYLNYLIDRPFDSEIEISKVYSLSIVDINKDDAINTAAQNREELNMLKTKGKVQEYLVKMNKYNRLPSLFAALDYGFQGEKYKFTGDDDFAMASFVLKWDLFKGFQNRALIRQAVLDQEITQTRITEVESQINLQVVNSFNEMDAAYKSIAIAESRFENSNNAFKFAESRYAEDRSDQIFFQQYLELLNVRSSAEKNMIETKYDFYIKHAEFERCSALYDLPEIENNGNIE